MRWVAVTLCLMCIAVWPVQAQESAYWQQLIQKSRDMHLAESPEWLNLLHYKPYPLWPGARSLADDPAFFNAVDGMKNPAAELEATLKAFFSDMQETDKKQNPQCRFIARYHWLHERLQFDSAQMPARECKRYNNWRKALNPHEITLVFPAAHLNSPASMYGHTLLRIDAKEQDERTRILAYTMGYTANTNEKNGLLFAIGSLLGWTPGAYQMLPYYLKVQEYSDMENRDIWEYRLNLNAQEIDRMLMHIWEVGPIYFDYYFLDENCAYHLLSLLEVARPSLRLTDEFRWWAIPTDTVRAVVEHENLMVDTVYRPSNATVIMHRLGAMPSDQRTQAKLLSMGQLSPDAAELSVLPIHMQVAVTELSLDYLTYLQSSDGESAEKSARVRKLLLARSAMDAPSALPEINPPQIRPDQGHKSLRVSVGGGNRDGVPYQEIAVRPAYHDQNDPGAGYIRGAQIQFFNLRLRHYGEAEGMRVEEFIPLDIFSLAPRNDFFQSQSWKVNVGWARKQMRHGNDPLIARLNAGGGYAWDLPSRDQPWAQIYTLLESTLESTSQYNGHYAWGAGPSVGIIADITDNWRLNAYARVQRFALGETHTVSEISLLQRYALGKQSALRLEVSRKTEFERYWSDINLAWQVYF